MDKVRYIAQYTSSTDADEYFHSPGGVAKMNYFLYCLSEMGLETEVFSTCQYKESGFHRKSLSKTNYQQQLIHIASFRLGSKKLNLLNIFFSQIQIFLYLLTTPSDTTVYFYHERFYEAPIKLARRLKKFRLVCDIEEIYTVHAKYTKTRIDKEIKYLKSFDFYTLASEAIAETLQLKRKQYIVCNGVYAPIIERKEPTESLVNVLYAGTFDTTKGGAKSAIEAFAFLPYNYHLNLCGFGTEEQIATTHQLLDDVNKKSKASLTYKGFIPNTSTEYRHLLIHSQIGLATQNPSGAYNSTSFPSKIFEYMRHGLRVVSSNISVASSLPITPFITFVQEYTPLGIASAIEKSMTVDIRQQTESLISMHKSFITNFRRLL